MTMNEECDCKEPAVVLAFTGPRWSRQSRVMVYHDREESLEGVESLARTKTGTARVELVEFGADVNSFESSFFPGCVRTIFKVFGM